MTRAETGNYCIFLALGWYCSKGIMCYKAKVCTSRGKCSLHNVLSTSVATIFNIFTHEYRATFQFFSGHPHVLRLQRCLPVCNHVHVGLLCDSKKVVLFSRFTCNELLFIDRVPALVKKYILYVLSALNFIFCIFTFIVLRIFVTCDMR